VVAVGELEALFSAAGEEEHPAKTRSEITAREVVLEAVRICPILEAKVRFTREACGSILARSPSEWRISSR